MPSQSYSGPTKDKLARRDFMCTYSLTFFIADELADLFVTIAMILYNGVYFLAVRVSSQKHGLCSIELFSKSNERLFLIYAKLRMR